jgi:hypothetical protein
MVMLLAIGSFNLITGKKKGFIPFVGIGVFLFVLTGVAVIWWADAKVRLCPKCGTRMERGFKKGGRYYQKCPACGALSFTGVVDAVGGVGVDQVNGEMLNIANKPHTRKAHNAEAEENKSTSKSDD